MDLVKQLVARLGSQKAVAEALGVDPAQISRYLRGQKPSRTVILLAERILTEGGVKP